MRIHIGQEVPLRGRELQDATSVSDQVWSLGLAGKESCMASSTAKAKYVATCSAIWEVVCFFWKILFDLIDLTCIFVWCREEQWNSSMWSKSRSFKRGSSSIFGETGCLSINPGEAHRLLRCKQTYRFSFDVIGLGEARRSSFDVIIPNVILC